MANKKISALTDLGTTPAVGDILPITDISDTSGSPNGTTKKVTVADLVAAAPQGDLVASNNLSDIGSAATARTNLGLGTAATSASTAFATSAQGSTADSALQPADVGTAAALDVGTADTNVVQLSDVGGTVKLPAVDASQLTGIEGTQIVSTGETGGTKFLREDGDGTCSWQPAGADVDGPLAIALRGTINPHIGAFPDQPFKAIDNPSNSVMVTTNASGELDFLIPDGGNIFLNSPTGGRVAPSFGFAVVEDATEPDIEVASGGDNYSVISGDSDTKGVNGLPFRQGFNLPDIGANPAPILISGGTIA